MPRDPGQNDLHGRFELVGCEVPGRINPVPLCNAAAAAQSRSVLRNKHRMSLHRRLLAVVAVQAHGRKPFVKKYAGVLGKDVVLFPSIGKKLVGEVKAGTKARVRQSFKDFGRVCMGKRKHAAGAGNPKK